MDIRKDAHVKPMPLYMYSTNRGKAAMRESASTGSAPEAELTAGHVALHIHDQIAPQEKHRDLPQMTELQ